MSRQSSPIITSHSSEPPIHLLSAIVVLALDWMWTFVEAFAAFTIIGILCFGFLSIISGALAFLAVYLIQYYVAKDSGGEALAKGIVMGLVVAVPFPVIGTLIGVPLLIKGL
jgi:hypothetical protein